MRDQRDQELWNVVSTVILELLRDSGVVVSQHPEVETLVSYQEGELEEDRADDIRLHLAFCDVCREELRQLELLDDGETDSPAPADAEAIEAAWQRYQARVRAGDSLERPSDRPWLVPSTRTPLATTKLHIRLSWRWVATAAMLVLLLGGSLWWVGFSTSTGFGNEAPLAVFERPFLADLLPDTEWKRRAPSDQEIRMPPATDLLILRLSLGDLRDHGQYIAEIYDASSAQIWKQEDFPRQPTGHFVLLVDRDRLPDARYLLVLSARNGDDVTHLADYSFLVASAEAE